jgi:hypothetical protein
VRPSASTPAMDCFSVTSTASTGDFTRLEQPPESLLLQA